MSSNTEVTVRFLAGTNLTEAITEAKAKCCQWDVANIKFTFNGTAISVTKHSDTQKLITKYHKSY